jgi:phosphoribosylformimino-5-aminoimidazole carboxamide ribotide isomerase
MIVIPAIDIKDGKVVRLIQGDYARQTVYSDSPVETAKRWAECGAKMIHIVDLDGALQGKMRNEESVRRIAKEVKVGIELGGGIRDEATIEGLLSSGIDRVVLGTSALDEGFLKRMAWKFRKRIVVGIDARDGIIRTNGWVASSTLKAVDFARRIGDTGIGGIIYTDISKDGMLEGPNIAGLEAVLKATSVGVIASGGVSTLEDITELKALESKGLAGIIIGKALYEGRIDLREAIHLC